MATSTVTVRAKLHTRDLLNELAAAEGVSVPELLDHLAERERERILLHDGLAALADMDGAARDAYLGEWHDWGEAPLDQPIA